MFSFFSRLYIYSSLIRFTVHIIIYTFAKKYYIPRSEEEEEELKPKLYTERWSRPKFPGMIWRQSSLPWRPIVLFLPLIDPLRADCVEALLSGAKLLTMLTLGERVDASVLLNLSRDCGFFLHLSPHTCIVLSSCFLIYLVSSLVHLFGLTVFYFSSLFFGCVDFFFLPLSLCFSSSRKKRAGEEEQYVRRTAPVGCPAAPPCRYRFPGAQQQKSSDKYEPTVNCASCSTWLDILPPARLIYMLKTTQAFICEFTGQRGLLP